MKEKSWEWWERAFFYFASATFVAFVTGNIFALPALYFLLHFLAVLVDFLVSSFAQGFLFGSTPATREWPSSSAPRCT